MRTNSALNEMTTTVNNTFKENSIRNTYYNNDKFRKSSNKTLNLNNRKEYEIL